MIEVTRSTEELILDDIIDVQQQLRRRVDELQDYTRAAVEASHRPDLPSGPVFYRAQASSAISPASGATIGSGTAFLVVLIGTTRYLKYPHKPIVVVNDTSSPIARYDLMIVSMVQSQNGEFTAFVADCGGSMTGYLSDEPHS